jgi:HAD superfamily hydrolase (TIGR01509 family)
VTDEQGTPACRVPPPGPPFQPVHPADWDLRRRRTLRRLAAARSVGADRGRSLTTVVLDMGGVVIPTLFETAAARQFPAGPLAGEPDYRAVEAGEVPERDYWAQLAQRRPDLDIGALWRSCSYVRREIRALLGRVAGRFRIVAFTNDMAHWFGDDWPARFPAVARFDGVLEAAKLGVLKPAPEAFRVAAQALGEDPRRCLFVDDLAANLDGARAAGMAAELFDVTDPAGSVARVARALGLPVDEPRRRRVWAP